MRNSNLYGKFSANIIDMNDDEISDGKMSYLSKYKSWKIYQKWSMTYLNAQNQLWKTE